VISVICAWGKSPTESDWKFLGKMFTVTIIIKGIVFTHTGEHPCSNFIITAVVIMCMTGVNIHPMMMKMTAVFLCSVFCETAPRWQ
jgi:hypothetical protein